MSISKQSLVSPDECKSNLNTVAFEDLRCYAFVAQINWEIFSRAFFVFGKSHQFWQNLRCNLQVVWATRRNFAKIVCSSFCCEKSWNLWRWMRLSVFAATQYYAAVLFNTGMRFEQGRVKQGMEGHAGAKTFFKVPTLCCWICEWCCQILHTYHSGHSKSNNIMLEPVIQVCALALFDAFFITALLNTHACIK